MAWRAFNLACFALLAGVQSDSTGERPIAKVVNMLKDMQAELEVEGKKDEEMYDQMACWCETNDKEKTKSIADAEQKLVELASTIESSTASAKRLDTEIKTLTANIAELKKALLEAEDIRAKELAEFNAEEKDTISSLQSLKGAINSLSKANSGSSLEQEQSLVQLAQVLRRRPADAVAAVAPHQRGQIKAFLQEPTRMSFLQMNSGLRASQPASGAIFGMLGQMKESFEMNIEASKKEEAQSAADYVSLKESKSKELEASKDQVEVKTQELAKAKETKACSDESLDDTEETLEADKEFLANLKGQCKNVDAEFEERKKARQEEVVAVGETIGILTSDEANDTMTKTMSLFQARAQSKRETQQRDAAAASLAAAGQKLHSRRLSFLAARVKIDAFAKVRENIDLMVGQLGKEQSDEVVKKDDCTTDLNTNEKQSHERDEHKGDLETEMNVLEGEISVHTEEEKLLRQEIYEAQVELKKASENRAVENQDFQTTIADQRATQAILDKAMKRMAETYSLLQVATHRSARRSAQDPPVKFEKQEKNAGGSGVITMLQGIIDESKALEKDAQTAENDAQAAYEGFVQDTSKQIEAQERQIIGDVEVVAKDTKKDVEDAGDRKGTVTDILALGEVGQTLHGGCDFTIGNFDVRQHARTDEMDALKESKMIFGAA